MDEISSEAIASLNTTINALFAGIAPAPVIDITPLKIYPTGLGGYIAPHIDPIGDRLGRRIDAQVRVLVNGDSPGALLVTSNAVQQAALARTRAELAQRNILRVGAETDFPPTTQANTRLLGFRFLYEFIKVPQEAGDIIQEIPINLSVS